MRILVATVRFPMLSETFVLKHAVGLARRGHEVWVMSEDGDPTLLRHEGKDAEELGRRAIRVESLSGSWFSVFVWAIRELPWSASTGRLVWATLCDLVSGRTGVGNRRTLSMAKSLANESVDFDLVHAQHGQVALSVARLVEAGFLDCPFVATFHGTDLNANRRKPNSTVFAPVWKLAAYCTVGSKHMAEHFSEVGLEDDACAVVPCGLDLREFTPKQRELGSYSDQSISLVAIGRLVPVKGTEFALRAVDILQRKGVRVTLEVVGGGTLLEDLRQLCTELGIDNSVKLHGGLPASETRRLLAQADIFVHPGIVAPDGSREGQGLVLAEAQAMQIPVVASRVGGIPESVVEGETALLVRPGDPEDLAQAIEELAGDATRREAMGLRGRAFVEERFDQERILDRWEAVYAGVVERP